MARIPIRAAAESILDCVDRWCHRARPPDLDLLRSSAVVGVNADDRLRRPFDRELVLRACGHVASIEDRGYPYVLLPGRGRSLCIHYSAFFGEWGERREWRSQFAGWFHRLRMFWPLADHHFLFLCDTFGVDSNGTYYKGIDGDFFVERAMDAIQMKISDQFGIDPGSTVTLGSSMGGTAALRFALRHHYAGAVAVTPHIDLDVSAARQGRLRHVAAIVGHEDVDAPGLRPVTREIARLVATVRPLPRLVVQSVLDDAGVHDEQVLPLVESWELGGGLVKTDFQATGGHTSEYATPEFFADAIAWCLSR